MKAVVSSLIAALIGFMIAHALQTDPPTPKPERIIVREPAAPLEAVVRSTIRAELHPDVKPAAPERTRANEAARRDGERIVQHALSIHQWTDEDRQAMRLKIAELDSPEELSDLIRPVVVAQNAGELTSDGPLL